MTDPRETPRRGPEDPRAPGQPPVACPFCHQTDTEFFALFGQFLLASQYYCHNCRTVFDAVRWTDPASSDQA